MSPILYAAFDNVVIFEGKQNNQPAMRANIWSNCDNDRCGIIDNIFDKEPFTYRDYAEVIANMPPIFIPTNRGEVYTGYQPTHEVIAQYSEMEKDIRHFMGMCFFDVRVKQYIEIRAIDGMPPRWSFAATALIKNLLYKTKNSEKLYDYAIKTNAKNMCEVQKQVVQLGMDATMDGQNLWVWLSRLLDMAISEAEGWEQEQILWLKQQFEARITPRQMRNESIGKYHCQCCQPARKDNQ
jgi:glutamate--cysteine ligase